MSTFLIDGWFILAKSIALLMLPTFFYYFKWESSPKDPFFTMQRWGLGQAVSCLIAIDVLGILMDAAIGHTSGPLPEFIVQLLRPLLFLVLLKMFFVYLRQPIGGLGISRKGSVSMVLVGVRSWLWVLLLICLVLSLLPTEWLMELSESKRYAELESLIKSYGLLWSAFASLLPTFWVSGLVSIVEEIEYRGLLYGALRKKVNARSAILVSALFFMFGHGEVHLTAFVLGCIAAFFVEKYHSVVPGIAFHMMWNFAVDSFTWIANASIVTLRAYFQTALLVTLLALTFFYAVRWLIGTRNGDRLNF
jgi:membrane protease YdiL (CAAX protease family)